MKKLLPLSPRLLGRMGAVSLLLLPSFPADAGDSPLPPASLTPVSGPASPSGAAAAPKFAQAPLVSPADAPSAFTALATGEQAVARFRAGETLRVDGVGERRFKASNGALVRALPGARFVVVGDTPEGLSLRLDEGTLSEVGGASARVDIHTRAFDVRADRALVSVRDLPGGVYVEHMTGSTGVVILASAGRADTQLAAGAFRMATFDDSLVAAPTASRRAGASPAVTATAFHPAGGIVTMNPVVTMIPAGLGAPTYAPTRAVTASMYVDGSQGTPVVPAPGPCVGNCNPCAPPPVVYVPCAPPPAPVCATSGCGEMITTSGVPIPDRADDAGRIPLGSALGARGPCNSCAGTECNRIPYVHYVEGLVCDVSTYKVGCCLITVRPASRVRAHRLPDGSIQLWAPNIGKDMALIEINENQFGYIGEDGFLVIGNDCQIEYFRGLVHLYPPRAYPPEDGPGVEVREFQTSQGTIIRTLPVPRRRR